MVDHLYFILLGSNLGNRVDHLAEASHKIEQRIGIVEKSSALYETNAWGKTDQPDFLNSALMVRSALEPSTVLGIIHAIESEQGRTRIEKWGERSIDIDILYVDYQIIDLPDLIVPHPEIQNRRFTLIPLVEIAPDFIHPLLHKSNRKLLERCTDQLLVRVFKS